MSVNKIVILSSAGLLALVAIIFFGAKHKESQVDRTISNDIQIIRTWELPSDLREISGMAYMGSSKIAAVQDEQGIIFIYNLDNSEIEKEVKFAGSGDYEGIALIENTAYVLRSDGNIFMIRKFLNNPQIEEISSDFSSENNLEGFYYDSNRNQFLIAVKAEDPYSKDYKGIYSLNPDDMEVSRNPAYKINFEDPFFDKIRKKDLQETFYPSEVVRDPNTGNLLVLEAETPRLLIMDSEGNPVALHELDRQDFPQPEGLTFDEEGRLYISNEGNPATIHRINIYKR